jgi:hypothetical protein
VGDDDHVARARVSDRVAVDEDDLGAARGGDALEHVAVGGEVAAVGDEPPPAAGVDRGRHQLVQVHGRRVGHDDLAGARAEHVLGEQVADARRRVDPVRPARHEPVAPLLDQIPQPVARGPRQPAERVAVEVDPFGVADDEPVAEVRERVGRVERGGVLAAQRIHRTTASQSALRGSRCP